jgi:hypothetical protein
MTDMEEMERLLEKILAPVSGAAKDFHMKPLHSPWRTAPQYTDGTRTYSRIAGGIGWPSHGNPGWFCVLGEDRDLNEYGSHDLHVLAEGDSYLGEPVMDPYLLFESMADQGQTNKVVSWYGMQTFPKLELVAFNKAQLLLKRPRLRVLPPPDEGSRGMAGYLQLVRRRVSSSKTLFFGEHQRIAAALSGLPADIDALRYDDHPAVTALLTAVAGLDLKQLPQEPTRGGTLKADTYAGY